MLSKVFKNGKIGNLTEWSDQINTHNVLYAQPPLIQCSPDIQIPILPSQSLYFGS